MVECERVIQRKKAPLDTDIGIQQKEICLSAWALGGKRFRMIICDHGSMSLWVEALIFTIVFFRYFQAEGTRDFRPL